MKRLLKGPRGQWLAIPPEAIGKGAGYTPDIHQAKNFSSSEEAIMFCIKNNLHGMTLVLAMNDDNGERNNAGNDAGNNANDGSGDKRYDVHFEVIAG